MSRPTRFSGRTVIVTGSTGMAASAAQALAAEGARVCVVSRTEVHARTLADEITAGGGQAAYAVAELSDEAAVEAAYTACLGAADGLDGLFHAAGISGRRFGDGLVHEAELGGWQAVMAANATSTFLVCRAAVRRMRGQNPDPAGRRGAIVTMSSVLARHPMAEHFGTHAYAASKGAIEALTRAMAAAYAAAGIRVNAVAPSLVATPMSERAQSDPAVRAYLERKQPLMGGPIGTDDITPTVLHLLSDDAAAITGQVIDIDAGWGVSEA